MGLIGNYAVLAKHPGRDIGGGATGLGYNRSDFAKPSMRRGAFTGADWEPKSGIPDGYRPPYAWVLPQTAGGLSSRNIVIGTGSLVASGAMGVNGTAALTGTGSLTASGALIVSAIAALSGSGSISTANLLAILQAAAALSGTGTLTAGSMTATGALASDLAGTGSLSAIRYAIGHMAADITPYSELSPESLATAVWSAIAADNNDVGSMGEKLNDAGSGSNPWTEVIEGSYTAAELLRIIAAALAGELSGAATTTITILGVDGSTERIVASVTTDGDRTAVTLDGS
jgi:hypothetical protein